MGTPQALSNERGECVWEIALNTWGETQEIKAQNTGNPLEQSDLRFQGQYYDVETGLHYNRYRYYEPFNARYISKDPIGLEGGLNNQTYVHAPTHQVDVFGLYESVAVDMSSGPYWDGMRKEFGRQQSCYERTGNFCKNELIGTKMAVAKLVRSVGADYLACSGNVGGGGWGTGYVLNVHNLKEYTSISGSLIEPFKNKDKDNNVRRPGKTLVQKGVNVVKKVKPSGSCVVGFINGIPKDRNPGLVTSQFLEGASYGGSVAYWLKYGVVKAVSDDPLIKSLTSHEVGISTPDFDIELGNTE